MRYVVESEKTPDQATLDLEAAVKRHQFGVLYVHDLKETLRNKGFDLPAECRVLEICNPKQAADVLSQDMDMNLALPCRISVYQLDGKTRIGMIRPTALLAGLSSSEALQTIAREVERLTIAMIEEAR